MLNVHKFKFCPTQTVKTNTLEIQTRMLKNVTSTTRDALSSGGSSALCATEVSPSGEQTSFSKYRAWNTHKMTTYTTTSYASQTSAATSDMSISISLLHKASVSFRNSVFIHGCLHRSVRVRAVRVMLDASEEEETRLLPDGVLNLHSI